MVPFGSSVPGLLPVVSLWRLCFQYRSSAPHTGFLYCAVDSITISSTSRSRSTILPVVAHAPDCYRIAAVKLILALNLDIGHHHTQHLLMHFGSAIL